MKKNRLSINYVAVSPISLTQIKEDHFLFNKIAKEYDWPYEEPAKIYRRLLLTPITIRGSGNTRSIIDHYKVQREEGDLEYMMFDSGGFQMNKREDYTLDKLIRENVWLYKRHDWGDVYILPDYPPLASDTNDVRQKKLETTMEAIRKTFDQLPPKVQKKSMPVFHVRSNYDLEKQCDSYRSIIEESQLIAYVPEMANVRFTQESLDNLIDLRIIFPDAKIHVLGVTTLLTTYILSKMGIESFNSSTATLSGAFGYIHFYAERYNYSHKKKNSITVDKLLELKKETGHRCPFCDDWEQLLTNQKYRIYHNLIIFDEFDHYLYNTTDDNFRAMYIDQQDYLARITEVDDPSIQLKLF